jgi:hypothetical protein
MEGGIEMNLHEQILHELTDLVNNGPHPFAYHCTAFWLYIPREATGRKSLYVIIDNGNITVIPENAWIVLLDPLRQTPGGCDNPTAKIPLADPQAFEKFLETIKNHP